MHPAENRLGRFRRLNVTAAGDPGSGGSAMRFTADLLVRLLEAAAGPACQLP
jgi:hypothetical protein